MAAVVKTYVQAAAGTGNETVGAVPRSGSDLRMLVTYCDTLFAQHLVSVATHRLLRGLLGQREPGLK